MDMFTGVFIVSVFCRFLLRSRHVWLPFFFLGISRDKPVKTKSVQATPPEKLAPSKEQNGEAGKKPAAASKQDGGGGGGGSKKGKKDEKKHAQCLFQLKGHSGAITCARVSMTGKMIATTGEDRRIILWNISTLPPTQTLSANPELDNGAAIALSPDDSHFAVAWARSKEVKIYATKEAKEGALVTFASKHTTDVSDLIWAYSGKFLVTFACKDKEAVRLWTPRGEALGSINPGALEAYCVVVSPDSRFVSIATMQCDAKIWELSTDKDGFAFRGKAMELTGRTGGGGAAGHSAAINSVDFGGSSPALLVTESHTAATGSKDGLCKVWNIGVRYRQNEDPKCSVTVEQPDKKPVALVALSRGKTAKYVATWSSSAGLIVWALPSGDKVSEVSAEDTGHVFRMEWVEGALEAHPDLLVAATCDGRTRAWLPRILP